MVYLTASARRPFYRNPHKNPVPTMPYDGGPVIAPHPAALGPNIRDLRRHFKMLNLIIGTFCNKSPPPRPWWSKPIIDAFPLPSNLHTPAPRSGMSLAPREEPQLNNFVSTHIGIFCDFWRLLRRAQPRPKAPVKAAGLPAPHRRPARSVPAPSPRQRLSSR